MHSHLVCDHSYCFHGGQHRAACSQACRPPSQLFQWLPWTLYLLSYFLVLFLIPLPFIYMLNVSVKCIKVLSQFKLFYDALCLIFLPLSGLARGINDLAVVNSTNMQLIDYETSQKTATIVLIALPISLASLYLCGICGMLFQLGLPEQKKLFHRQFEQIHSGSQKSNEPIRWKPYVL